MWFALDEVSANIPATSHLLSSEFWIDLVLPLVFARYRRIMERASCGCCRRTRRGYVTTESPLGAALSARAASPRAARSSVVYRVPLQPPKRRGLCRVLWSAVSQFPSAPVIHRQEEYSRVSYDQFVSTSERFFRITMVCPCVCRVGSFAEHGVRCGYVPRA